jgi:cytochrome b
MPDEKTLPAAPVRVWDLPTRLFHWALVACVIGLIVSGNVGGNALVWHMRLGLLVGALLLFRIVWGLVGGRWSRFANFICAPATVLRYMRGQARPGDHFEVGHNPLGSFSVFGLLALLALQVASGSMADDEIATTGPLNRFVSIATASLATGWHRGLGKALVVALVLLHVAAIVYYLRRKKQNLISPMLTGDKVLPAGTPASTDNLVARGLAALLFAACAGLAAWVASLGG